MRRGRCAGGAYTAFGEVYQTLKSINGGAGVYFGKALLALKSVSALGAITRNASSAN